MRPVRDITNYIVFLAGGLRWIELNLADDGGRCPQRKMEWHNAAPCGKKDEAAEYFGIAWVLKICLVMDNKAFLCMFSAAVHVHPHTDAGTAFR